MRDLGARIGGHFAFDPQEIEVDCACAPADPAHAAELGLDHEEALDDGQGGQGTHNANGRVPIAGLRRTDGIGLPERRGALDASEALEAAARALEGREPIAEVRA